jgi:hypothetical protein
MFTCFEYLEIEGITLCSYTFHLLNDKKKFHRVPRVSILLIIFTESSYPLGHVIQHFPVHVCNIEKLRFPTAAARVQTRVGTWDFVMDKSGAGACFLRELRFPLPIYIPSCSPQSSSLSPQAGTIGQEWPQFL